MMLVVRPLTMGLNDIDAVARDVSLNLAPDTGLLFYLVLENVACIELFNARSVLCNGLLYVKKSCSKKCFYICLSQ